MAEMFRHWLDLVEGLNLVLLGKTGAGKSASGNTILGRQAFKSKESFTSVTLNPAVESSNLHGQWVTVYDTPGLFNTKLSEEEIQQIYAKVLRRCESGPCVFLLVIRADRFTEKERKTVEKIEELLGEKRLKRTWILFTGRDELEDENMSIDEFINDTEPLKNLVQKYDQRYHVFNNKKKEPNGQVQELLRKIYATYPDTAEGGAKPKQTRVKGRALRRVGVTSKWPGAHVVTASPRCRASRISIDRRGSLIFNQPNMSLRRMVLVGMTGAGKSSSGNTILGRNAFRAARSGSSVTKECGKQTEEEAGREITVVDTPGMFDTDISEEDLLKQKISKCINMTAPGPHAIILVIKLGPFTEEERDSVEKIRAIFGEEADKHTIVLFTHGDKLTGSIEEYLRGASEDLKEILRCCGGRYHVFNNKDMEDRNQVVELLEKIDDMVTANGGGFYTSDSYQDVELMLKTKEEELRQEYEKKLQDKERELESRFTEEKQKLEERIESLTASDQEKQEKIRELERLNRSKKCKKTEYKRYYDAKLGEARQEAERTYVNQNIIIKIFKKFCRIKC